MFSSIDLFSSSSINELFACFSSKSIPASFFKYLLFESAWDNSYFSSKENSVFRFILPELYIWLLLAFLTGDAWLNYGYLESWTWSSIKFRCWKAARTFGLRPWLARVGGMKLFTCWAWYWYCCCEMFVNYWRWFDVKLAWISPPCSDILRSWFVSSCFEKMFESLSSSPPPRRFLLYSNCSKPRSGFCVFV